MTEDEYKKYTAQAKAAIKGEAFFETLVSDYSIPHHIVGSKDIGLDYICEWVYGNRPAGILYAVQIKTLSKENVRIEPLGNNRLFNSLDQYRISNPLLTIDNKTQQYWRGFGLPVYLFAIIYSNEHNHGDQFNCYYKRFTSILTTPRSQEEECFYKVNRGATFLAFADQETKKYGFARDLFIDLMRCAYHKGSITYLSPTTLGLEQFPPDGVFSDLFMEYKEKIQFTYAKTSEYLDRIRNDQAIPSAAPDEEEPD